MSDRPLYRQPIAVLVVAAAAIIGGIGGFILGRLAVSASGESLSTLAGLISDLVQTQSSGPIVAAGIAAGSSILGAVLVPAVTVFVLEKLNHRMENP